MEGYKKVNAELVAQVQQYKQKQRLYELQHMQALQESLIHKRIIREQRVVIESFVRQNSQDLNAFLGHLVDGHQKNMSVVAEFAQNMLRKLETLLVHISSENPPGSQHPAPSAATTATAPPPAEVRRPPRMHRSLSPVIGASKDDDEEEEDHRPKEFVNTRTRHQSGDESQLPSDIFITKRRRKCSPAPEEEEEEPAMVVRVTPTDPVTLPDGMLSTIAETSKDGRMDMTASLNHISEVEDDEEEEVEEEEEEQDVEEEEKEEESENEIEEVENETVADVLEIREPEAEKENQKLSIIDENAMVALAASTPNPRKRTISSRAVLSPVDTNRDLARSKVRRRRTPSVAQKEMPDENRLEGDVSISSRPRRRAAPRTLTEPSLRDKLRR